MSKYVVLVLISLISTIITFIIVIIRAIYLSNNGSRYNIYGKILLYLHINWFNIDLIVNIICFMAQFRFFGNKYYYKFCKCLDKKCKNFVKYKTMKYMDTQRTNTIQSVQMSPISLSKEASIVVHD